MSRSMSFLINDASTEVGGPQVRVTITEGSNGQLLFSVTQDGAVIGDLRGLFFDLADKALVGSLRTSTANTGFSQGLDKVKDLGEGANMNGLTGSGKGYDAGIKIGTAGIGKDDIRNYDFSLTSTVRALTLDDFANVDFAARLTSVGTLGGSRNDSSKLLEKPRSLLMHRMTRPALLKTVRPAATSWPMTALPAVPASRAGQAAMSVQLSNWWKVIWIWDPSRWALMATGNST